MKFEILSIHISFDKVYVSTKCLELGINFFVSETSLLGGFELEQYLDQSRSIDENGEKRSDRYVFQLKKNADREKINIGDILILTDNHALVIEMVMTISGRKMGCVLEYSAGIIPLNTLLIFNNKKWITIEEADFILQKNPNFHFYQKAKEKNWLLYWIRPVDHSDQPEVGCKLIVNSSDT